MLDLIKDPKFIISMLMLGIGAVCVFMFSDSNPHLILGTNIITGIGGYWIGTSFSSAFKDKTLFGGKLNEDQKDSIVINDSSAVG